MFCRRCGTRNPDGSPHCTLCGEGLQPGVEAMDPAALHARAHAPAVAALVYAGFWRRAAALVLDTLVLFFPVATVRVLFGMDLFGVMEPESPAWWAVWIFEVLLSWLYAVLLISGPARGTLGQQVMDLQVAGLRGQRVSFGRATWRYFAQFLTLCTFGIGYLMQVMNPRRQTLHDLVSATVVVRPTREDAPAAAPVWGRAR